MTILRGSSPLICTSQTAWLSRFFIPRKENVMQCKSPCPKTRAFCYITTSLRTYTTMTAASTLQAFLDAR